MKRLSLVLAILSIVGLNSPADAVVNSFFEDFDGSFSGAVLNPSVQGNRVDDNQKQVGWARSPGYFAVSETKPWTPVGPMTDFTGGGDGALLLGHASGHARTTSTADTMGIGTYSWDFEWEDFHNGTPPGGVTNHIVGTPVSPGEKRFNVVLMSSNSGANNGGDPGHATGGVQIAFGQTGEGGGLAVLGKTPTGNEFLYTYSEHGQAYFYDPTCWSKDWVACAPNQVNERLWHTGAESRPWIQLASADNHVDGLKITAQVDIVENSPGVYLMDLIYGQTDNPDTAANEFQNTAWLEINDLDVSQYIADVEGGVGAPNGYWNMGIGDAGWVKLDNLSFQAPVPPLDCDFNDDGNCNLADINAMYGNGNLVTGVAVGNGNKFDLNGDNSINQEDIGEWLSKSATENGYGSPYRRGDADGLDTRSPTVRDVDITDFNALAANFDAAGTGPTVGNWHLGNFDGDGDIDITDFNFLADNFTATGYSGTSEQNVPEPTTWILILVGIAIIYIQNRCRR